MAQCFRSFSSAHSPTCFSWRSDSRQRREKAMTDVREAHDTLGTFFFLTQDLERPCVMKRRWHTRARAHLVRDCFRLAKVHDEIILIIKYIRGEALKNLTGTLGWFVSVDQRAKKFFATRTRVLCDERLLANTHPSLLKQQRDQRHSETVNFLLPLLFQSVVHARKTNTHDTPLLLGAARASYARAVKVGDARSVDNRLVSINIDRSMSVGCCFFSFKWCTLVYYDLYGMTTLANYKKMWHFSSYVVMVRR